MRPSYYRLVHEPDGTFWDYRVERWVSIWGRRIGWWTTVCWTDRPDKFRRHILEDIPDRTLLGPRVAATASYADGHLHSFLTF